MKKFRISSEQMADQKWYPKAILFEDTITNSEIIDKPFNTKAEADEYIRKQYENNGYYIEIV